MMTFEDACALLFGLAGSAPAADKTLIDYFLPMPVQGKLTKDAWGADNVLPRDPGQRPGRLLR